MIISKKNNSKFRKDFIPNIEAKLKKKFSSFSLYLTTHQYYLLNHSNYWNYGRSLHSIPCIYYHSNYPYAHPYTISKKNVEDILLPIGAPDIDIL